VAGDGLDAPRFTSQAATESFSDEVGVSRRRATTAASGERATAMRGYR